MGKPEELFKQFDKNDNDTIEWNEFSEMIDLLQEGTSLKDKTTLFHEVDSNHTGMISFAEFRDWWSKRSG